MVIWWWFWDFVGILLGFIGILLDLLMWFTETSEDLGVIYLGFDGIDGNPLIFFNQCLWTGFDIASVPQIP